MSLRVRALAASSNVGRQHWWTGRRRAHAVITVALGICVVVFSRQLYMIRAQVLLDSQLIDAVRRNDLRSVSSLIDKGASPNATAIGTNKVSFTECVKRYIRDIIERDLNSKKLPSALLVALNAWWEPEGGTDRPPQNTEIVKLLITHGADVNYRYADGGAPIICASISGRPHTVQVLVDSGANISVKDEYGYSALDYADGRHQHSYVPAIISILKRAGARD